MLDDNGQMSWMKSKLTAAFNKDPAAVKKLFTDDKRGFATKLNEAIEQLAGEQNSLLSAAQRFADEDHRSNNKRIEQMTRRLGSPARATVARRLTISKRPCRN